LFSILATGHHEQQTLHLAFWGFFIFFLDFTAGFYSCSDLFYYFPSLFSGRSNPGLDLTSNATPPGEQTTFKWIIDGFSSLLDKDQGWTYSNVFEIMGVKWYGYYCCYFCFSG
jgi:hypothetical protein